MKGIKNYLLWGLIVFFGVGIFLTGCPRSINTKIEFSDAEIDMSAYKSFSWPDHKPLINEKSHLHPIISNQIKVAIQEQFESKGYRFGLNPIAVDFLVSYAISATDEGEHEPASQLEIDHGECHHPLSEPYNLSAFPDKDDRYAVLVISVFDVNRCLVVWQARSTTLFNPHNTELNQINKVNETVDQVLAEFPRKH